MIGESLFSEVKTVKQKYRIQLSSYIGQDPNEISNEKIIR